MPFLFIGLFILIAVTLAIFGHQAAKRRRAELFQLAISLGFQFQPQPGDVHDRYLGFAPFGVGSSKRSACLLHGTEGEFEWELFDYRYTTGSGKNRQTHHYGIIAASIPLNFPKMQIRPEGFFDKIASFAGFDDINFESGEFSRRYHVTCADRTLAYDLIHPQMIEFLLSGPLRTWQTGGRRILLIRGGKFPAAEIPAAMDAINNFVKLLPNYFRADRSSRPG
jgi:hypothetical protein